MEISATCESRNSFSLSGTGEEMSSIVDLERAIVNFVKLHPDGVTFEELSKGVKERNKHYDLERCASSLVFHNQIEERNGKGEIYNPNHYQNEGTFKYFPFSGKPRKEFNKYYPFESIEEVQKYKSILASQEQET